MTLLHKHICINHQIALQCDFQDVFSTGIAIDNNH